MTLFEPAGDAWVSRMRSVMRVVVAILFIQHGSQKLFGFPGTGNGGAVDLLTMQGFAGVLEAFGGFALLIGFLVRPIAFLASGEMAVAYFMFHSPRGFLPIVNRGELAATFCFVFLYLAFAGGGVWSVDAALSSRRRARVPI